MKDNPKFYKLCEDEILDIINDYLCQINNYENSQSKLLILGTPNKDLRVLAAITPNSEDQLDELDLEKVDEELEYNGEKSSLNSSNSIDMANIDNQLKIKKLLEKFEGE